MTMLPALLLALLKVKFSGVLVVVLGMLMLVELVV